MRNALQNCSCTFFARASERGTNPTLITLVPPCPPRSGWCEEVATQWDGRLRLRGQEHIPPPTNRPLSVSFLTRPGGRYSTEHLDAPVVGALPDGGRNNGPPACHEAHELLVRQVRDREKGTAS